MPSDFKNNVIQKANIFDAVDTNTFKRAIFGSWDFQQGKTLWWVGNLTKITTKEKKALKGFVSINWNIWN